MRKTINVKSNFKNEREKKRRRDKEGEGRAENRAVVVALSTGRTVRSSHTSKNTISNSKTLIQERDARMRTL